ncbi:phosphonate metabolism protein/1,5-bisphosphokinase (PRPP-forming) PhnN [Microvirga sp. VF16]|uniref:phosphonate metabolism protein/1,5-bisphosphokinase (PRPP-forming) PhnN n=1 Tax=Microvirga sp. VF16 TaxID=2807101 RepID=UPI001FEDBA12|nr:phosphonate metabolism protein/1,5-bisphosphokinase (PRPP-forming) PhnN [Microvirga sp. VF16]
MVVGASGAGKDSLIDYARQRLSHESRIQFVRRTITRPPSVGEDHVPMDADGFRNSVEHGAFALHWDAHGLHYGLPVVINDWLSQGHVVVANGSRAILPEARRHYPDLQIINIVASPEILAKRLEARGREESASRQARLARSVQIDANVKDAITIDNSGELSIAGDQLVSTLAPGVSSFVG